MNYREVKRLVRIAAAGHLYSLEIHDEFPEEDEGRVDRAIREIQAEIRGRIIYPAPAPALPAASTTARVPPRVLVAELSWRGSRQGRERNQRRE